MRHARPVLVLSSLLFALLACGGEMDAALDLDSAATGLTGSCEGSCGEASATGDCWCDAACAQYGDCCADKAAVCDAGSGGAPDAPKSSCAGACGFESPQGGCWCDAACASYGDCCSDKVALCDGGAPVSPEPTCADACGGKSASGACWCDAECAHYGDCCADKVDLCDGGGDPEPEPEPEPEPDPEPEPESCVRTGCSGHVCAPTDLFTTCEWHPYYACYQQATCEVQADGQCGFTMDADLEACLVEQGAL
jgi:hypothetical protein